MRVALVYRNFNLSGSLERDSVLLARGLVAAGAEVHCYCNPDVRTAEIHGVTFHDVRPLVRSRSRFGYPIECGSFAAEATRKLRQHRRDYDVIDVRGIAALEHDVVTVHGVWAGKRSRWPTNTTYRAGRVRAAIAPVLRPQVAVAEAIERRQFAPGRFRRAIAVCEQVRSDLVEAHRVPEAQVDLIPPPVDVEEFSSHNGPGVRALLGIARDDPVLLFIGNEFDRKGLPEAIESLAALNVSAQLVVVGGDKQKPYARLARSLGVVERVHFVGKTESPQRYYTDADLLFFPTRSDPWGIPLIEAMAAGLPVVTSGFAGAAEIVEGTGAGIVLDSTSPRELAHAVACLLASPGRRREMGERGLKAARRFSVEEHAGAVLETYRHAIRESRNPAKKVVAAGTIPAA